MREIKFRLILHKKIIGYEKWYGGLFSEISGQTANACWLYSKDNKYWKPDFLWHEEKNQYTGLKGMKGVEIYEGDIVRVYTFISEEEPELNDFSVHQIKYMIDMDYPAFDLEPTLDDECNGLSWAICASEVEGVEVIGNIYQNPKLLEQVK